MIGDSNIRPVIAVVDEKNLSPLKSRSTVIFIACLMALLYVNLLCWIAGFFSEAIALISIYLVRDIMLGVMGHQKDAAMTTTSAPPNSIVQTETKTQSTT